jgi:predicted transcriptional regulator
MKSEKLERLLQRVESLPAETQAELADILQDIVAGLSGEFYQATPEELKAIDLGLRDAAEGRFATDQEVEAAFAKFRGK